MLKKIVSVMAILFAASSATAATVDQSNLGTGGNALTIDNNVIARAQTFTVGLAGELTGVRLRLSDKGNSGNFPDAELTIGIFDVSGGNIDIAGGALLSQTIGRVLNSTGSNDFKLFETNFGSSVSVSVGDTLAIVLNGVNANQNDGFYWAQSGGYNDGTLWSDSGSGLIENTLQDFEFATLVDTTPTTPIPLPAALPLLLAGLGALGLLRRRA